MLFNVPDAASYRLTAFSSPLSAKPLIPIKPLLNPYAVPPVIAKQPDLQLDWQKNKKKKE